MSKFIGRKINIGLGKESVRGTAVAPTYWIKQLNADIDDKFEGVISEDGIGVIEDAQDFTVVKQWAEGNIEGKVYDKSFGLILLAALGSVSSAVKSGETVVYEHTFSVDESAQHQSLTIEVKNPNEQLAYANAVLNSLELSFAPGDFLKFVAGFVSKKGVTASNTPSYITENHFIGKNVQVKIADNLSGLDGASAINVLSARVSITKDIEHEDILGSIQPNDLLNKQLAVEGELELQFDSATYKSLALAGTQKALRIQATNGDVTIGSTSNPDLKIDLAKVKFTEFAKSGGLGDIIKQTLTFKGLYSIGDSQMIKVVLTNEVSSY